MDYKEYKKAHVEDPRLEARILEALKIPVPDLVMPELPGAQTTAQVDGLRLEARIAEALRIPVPDLVMPELPEIETDFEESRQANGEDPHFEARIVEALKIPVPDLVMPELPEIETGNVVSLSDRRPRRTPVWFAMAATVALAAVLGVKLFEPPEYASLADEIVAHLDHEPYATRVTDVPVSDKRLKRIVPANIANLDHEAGLITYAQTCNINGNDVPHLVIQGKNGPVTVILLPDERVSTAETFGGESINGVLIPVGNGSIAIIGEKNEDLEAIQKSVMNSVTWST